MIELKKGDICIIQNAENCKHGFSQSMANHNGKKVKIYENMGDAFKVVSYDKEFNYEDFSYIRSVSYWTWCPNTLKKISINTKSKIVKR